MTTDSNTPQTKIIKLRITARVEYICDEIVEVPADISDEEIGKLSRLRYINAYGSAFKPDFDSWEYLGCDSSVASDKGAHDVTLRAWRNGRWIEADEVEPAELRSCFSSPYEQHASRNGQRFKLLGPVNPDSYDAADVGPMYRIAFEDGTEIQAWPEEIYLVPRVQQAARQRAG